MTGITMQAPTQPDIWDTLVASVQDNPTLAMLSLLVGAFLAGFAARKFLEDRSVTNLRLSLQETRSELSSARDTIAESGALASEQSERARRLRKFLAPEVIRSSLTKHLAEFPPENRETVVASLMRQLLFTGGHAWLCTPSATLQVFADFDELKEVSEFRTETDMVRDPIRDLRKAMTSKKQLAAAMHQLSAYGITRVAIEVDADHQDRMVAMQGPGLSWSVVTHNLERFKEPDQG